MRNKPFNDIHIVYDIEGYENHLCEKFLELKSYVEACFRLLIDVPQHIRPNTWK